MYSGVHCSERSNTFTVPFTKVPVQLYYSEYTIFGDISTQVQLYWSTSTILCSTREHSREIGTAHGEKSTIDVLRLQLSFHSIPFLF
jgi:hypothetical protein